ncbi:MAG: NfeD family protein [Acidobacteriota bacterium]|nr:MAG: NfeD family protein [Acidobacteriota bacterium]
MTTKSTPTVTRAVWLLVFCFGAGGQVLGLQEAEEPETPVATIPATVFRVPIEGTVDLGMAPFVARVVEEASRVEGAVVLLDIDTFGGRVDAAVLIRDALIEAPIRTVAFIHPRAISAGALISLACEDIVIAPGGSIGAATPITGGGNEEPTAVGEKYLSYMRTEMRTTAETRGRRGEVAEAMVDRDVEIEGVVEKGKVLTLSTDEALALEIADYQAATLQEALEVLNLSGAEVEEREMNWAEVVARAVSEPVVSSLLMSIGFLGIMIELYQPGWGLPGSLGAVALGTFFFGHHVAQLAGWEELLLFALGAALLAVEMFVIPGFGVFGVAGVALMLAGVVLSLVGLDLRVSWDLGFINRALMMVSTSIIVTAVGGALMMRLLPATGVTRRFVLGKALSTDEGFSSHDTTEKETFPLGTLGEAVTDLRPAGKVKFDARRIDAVSEGEFITAGATVKIIGWRSGDVVVREDK